MTRYVVARTADIPEGGRLLVDVRGKSIGIFRVNDRFHAVLNRCPHQGAELCKGAVLNGLTSSGPGDFAFDLERASLVCPWHGWEFDLATGQSYFDARRTRVRSYELEVRHGEEIASAIARAEESGERVPGPYVAGIVDVSTEDDYVVLAL